MKTDELPSNPKTPEALLLELHGIVAEAEKVLGATLSECAEENTDSLRRRFATAQKRLVELYVDASGKVRTGAKQADATIRSHPYEAIAAALGVGALLGVLLRHKNGPAGSRR